MACLCLHYTYLSYMTDCHFVYVILLERCCSICTVVQHSYLIYSWWDIYIVILRISNTCSKNPCKSTQSWYITDVPPKPQCFQYEHIQNSNKFGMVYFWKTTYYLQYYTSMINLLESKLAYLAILAYCHFKQLLTGMDSLIFLVLVSLF